MIHFLPRRAASGMLLLLSHATAASSGSEAAAYFGMFFHPSNHVPEKRAPSDTLEEASDGHFDVEIPMESPDGHEGTRYQERCKTLEDLDIDLPVGKSVVSVIGVTPIIAKEMTQFVHHIAVHTQEDCTEDGFLSRSMMYAFSPGDEGVVLPDDVGFPLFDAVHNRALVVAIHYTVPPPAGGIRTGRSSFGARFYHARDERAHRAGVLEVGDPQWSLFRESFGDDMTRYAFTCPAACSSSVLGKEGSREDRSVTIISEFLHMHKGVKMTNEVIRDDEVVHRTLAHSHEFDRQGVFHVPQDPFEVLPGDSIRTTCYSSDGAVFGLPSREETTCAANILYYPAREFSNGRPWTCPYNPWDDFGTGCAARLDLRAVDDL